MPVQDRSSDRGSIPLDSTTSRIKMSTPKIQARTFEGQTWISVADHKLDVARYKVALSEKDVEIGKLKALLASKPASQGSVLDEMIGGIFGGIGKKP